MTSTAIAPQGDLFPELFATLDYLDQAAQAKQLAQRVAPICADEGKHYPVADIQQAAVTVLALRTAQQDWPEWLQTHVKERPTTRAAIEVKKAALMTLSKARAKRKMRWYVGMVVTLGFALPLTIARLNGADWIGAIGGSFLATLMVGVFGALFTFMDNTPEEKECYQKWREVEPNHTGWPMLAASAEASALYRAWTATGEPITALDWDALMAVRELEASRKAQRQVLAPHDFTEQTSAAG